VDIVFDTAEAIRATETGEEFETHRSSLEDRMRRGTGETDPSNLA
jgi:hypothetical protein